MLGRECLVHAEHDEPVPIEQHHVRPLARGGGDSQQVGVCANAHGRIHHLLDDLESFALDGMFATAYRLWRTDGTPKEDGVPLFADLGHAARWSKRWRKELGAL